MTTYHFFISRAGEDSEWAKWISNVLEAAGHTTTLQDFDFKPGDNIPYQMTLALERADHVIALFSAPYLTKDFTRTELYAAFFSDPLGKKRRTIPVLVAPHEGSLLFNQFAYINFVGKDRETCKQLLLDAIQPERIVEFVDFPGAASQATSPKTFIRTLPTVDPHLFGRDAQLAWLEQSWSTRRSTSSRLSPSVAPARRPS